MSRRSMREVPMAGAGMTGVGRGNPYHRPAGSPQGGQFTGPDSAGVVDAEARRAAGLGEHPTEAGQYVEFQRPDPSELLPNGEQPISQVIEMRGERVLVQTFDPAFTVALQPQAVYRVTDLVVVPPPSGSKLTRVTEGYRMAHDSASGRK